MRGESLGLGAVLLEDFRWLLEHLGGLLELLGWLLEQFFAREFFVFVYRFY